MTVASHLLGLGAVFRVYSVFNQANVIGAREIAKSVKFPLALHPW